MRAYLIPAAFVAMFLFSIVMVIVRARQWRAGHGARKRMVEIMQTEEGREGLKEALRGMNYIEINFPNRVVFVSRVNPLNRFTFTHHDNTKESNPQETK